MTPINTGTPNQFAIVRGFLDESQYSTQTVLTRLGLKRESEFLKLVPDPAQDRARIDALGLLIRLFLSGEFTSDEEVRKWMPEAVIESFAALGLLASGQKPGAWHGTVSLYPSQGVYVSSDRWTMPDLSPLDYANDAVYPAITPNTLQFMDTLPRDPCGAFLEQCAGTGIAALHAAANYAGHAWSLDITQRATDFANFNARLNGLANFTALQGDLYEPVRGMTFDRIVAHPPYVPSAKNEHIFKDGGEDGERITARVIQEAPPFLKRGGRLYCLAAGVEREGEPYESRVRQWLGADEAELDVAVIVRKQYDLERLAMQLALKEGGGMRAFENWQATFARHRIAKLPYCETVIQRKSETRRCFTVTRDKGPQSGSRETEWLLRVKEAAAKPAFAKHLMTAKLAPSIHLKVTVLNEFNNGVLEPVRFTMRVEYPFASESEIQQWMANLLQLCDGKTPARDVYMKCKENGLISPVTPEQSFAELLSTFVVSGYLENRDFPLPQQ